MKPTLRARATFILAAFLAGTLLATGCKSGKNTQANAGQTPNQGTANQAPTQDQAAALSIDDLVAPIALYPDQLLAQVLTASTTPQEVLDGGNWLIQNQNLKGDALTNAAKQAGFGPSMQYLMSFPQVVDNMCQEMDWTTQLGEAFKSDQKGVMDAVQRKRSQAQQMGNLSSSPQMTVATKTDNGQQYVEIKPADPNVVYVPQYNPVTIYNNPAPAAPAEAAPAAAAAPATTTTTTTETQKSGVSTGAAVGIGLLSFGVGMAIGSAIHHDDYYPYPSWGYGGMYYGGRPYYPPPYRPVYPGYRPAPYYRPPANYRWSQYNRNVNVNNNYYTKFNNQNRTNNLQVNNRPGYGNTNARLGSTNNRPVQNQNWKGQSTYLGAHPQVGNQKPGAGMANALPANAANRNLGNQRTTQEARRPNAGNTSAYGNRQNVGGVNQAASREPIRQNNAAGAGGMNRGGATPNNLTARNSPPPNMNRGGDRGYSAPSSRPAAESRPAPSASPAAQNRSGGAFAGGNSGHAERQASNRGRSSMGASGGGGHKRR